MGRHDGHHDEAIAATELLARAAEEGCALHLNWSTRDTDPRGLAAIDTDWPTGVLPRIDNAMPDPHTTDTAATEVLRRTPRSIPKPLRPVRIERDPDLLKRVRDGLRRLT
ncbi:hypothetical protein [Kibdelosporangium phytohabitans]|uniref:Uncharacterized protein n=1 Tax=Kibdelosporangium phytohabitans TaxID=860235 RepID=A0A0N9HSS2_9PSEU|nr:hypothetical protein [Kibdelosporangium phytohabitans]ALG06357.1 hypothetical protein AOZ06_04955 [Kibdelosporangium phytohabitans]MBE1467498.1 hypothetical protein [Kibdelosporangium phytohabitans]